MPAANTPQIPPIEDRLTWAEVEELTGLGRWIVRYRIKKSLFPRPVKLDGHWPVFSRREVEAYMRARRKELAAKNSKPSATVRLRAYQRGER